ncbi:MAG: GNAT family protein [Pseudomonadota bacterium]
MKLDAPGLENAAVALELFQIDHLEFLKESGAVDFMWRFMPDIPRGASAESYAAHILQQQDQGLLVAFSIKRQSDGEHVGVVNFENIDRTHRRLRIANIWLRKDVRGTGVFEATHALLISRALEWGARRVSWIVPANAEALQQALYRIGAIEEGRLRSYTRVADGSWSDMILFSMIRDEAQIHLDTLDRKAGGAPATIGEA